MPTPRDGPDDPGDFSPTKSGADSGRPGRVRFIGESYRLLFERNPLPMWVYDVKSLYFLAVNDAAVAQYGYSKNEFFRMTIKDIRPREDLPALMKELERLDSGTESIGIWRHLRRDGTIIDVEVRANEIDFDGHRARIALVHDITERLRVERRLRTGFAVTRVLGESASFPDAIPHLLQAVCEEAGWEYGELWSSSVDGRVLRWEGAWHIAGFPSGEFEAASRATVVQPGMGIPGRTWVTGRPEWLEELTPRSYFARAKPAEALGLRQGLSFPITGHDRRVLGVMGFFSRTVREPDPTFLDLMADLGQRVGQFLEAQRSEAERRRTEERFSKAFHESPTPAAVTRLSDGKIIDANESFLRAYEFQREEVLGRSSRELAIWSDPEQRERLLEPVRRGGPVRGVEQTFRTKSGRTWTALVFVEPITLEEEPTILTTLVDVTNLREAERQMLEMDRLASIGRTASYVAHELNTPLTNIALVTASLRRELTDPALLERLDRIDTQRRMAARIIEEVLSFTKSTDLRREETDLAILLRIAADQAAAYRRAEVAFQLEVSGPEAPVPVDPLKMSQVFVNLIKNAFQATERGTVTVSLRREDGAAIVAVRDTGKGISPEERERLFQPFFTTKAHGEGVGLGLTFVKAVVEAHGGRIEVDSEPGQGTTFTVRFPTVGSAE